MDKLYNKDLKMAYIDNYFGEENTKKTILFLFAKTGDVEKQYDKDVYAFNDKEIASLLLFLKRDNVDSLNRDLSILKDYVNWCTVNGKRGVYENGENRIAIFQTTEDMSKYVSIRKVKNKYLTKKEFNYLVDYLENPIDKILIQSIYEFIGGEKLHEFRNLKIEDVENAKLNNNRIKLVDLDGSKRYSTISDKLIKLLEEANEQKEYVSGNGELINRVILLTESPYIFRMINRETAIDEMAGYGGIINKLNRIKKMTGYDLITVNSIRETRVIHEVVDVMEQLKEDKMTDSIYKKALSNLEALYDVEFSITQIYSIKRKCEQVIKLKEF